MAKEDLSAVNIGYAYNKTQSVTVGFQEIVAICKASNLIKA